MRSRILLGLLSILTASVAACSAPTSSNDAHDGVAGDEQDVTQGEALAKTLHYANLSLRAPEGWDTWVEGDQAYVGPLAGGPEDMAFVVERNHEGGIDTLAPSECKQEGDAPIAATSVKVEAQGLQPIGEKKAEYRMWKVTCADGSERSLRGWLLPISKIAVRELSPHTSTPAVLKSATFGAAGAVHYQNVALKLPAQWDIAQYDAEDEAFFGPLAGGNGDMPLRIARNFEGSVDALAPKTCYVEGDPAIAGTATVVEEGLRPIGDKKANYKKWKVACSDGTTREHRAWVLPVSKLGFFEQHAGAGVDAILTAAKFD